MGLFANRANPWLACSPHGIFHDPLTGELIPIEIEMRTSQFTAHETERVAHCADRMKLECKVGDDSWRTLVKHKAQVTHQAAVLHSRHAYYVVATRTTLCLVVKITFTSAALDQYLETMTKVKERLSWVHDDEKTVASQAEASVPKAVKFMLKDHVARWRAFNKGVVDRDERFHAGITAALRASQTQPSVDTAATVPVAGACKFNHSKHCIENCWGHCIKAPYGTTWSCGREPCGPSPCRFSESTAVGTCKPALAWWTQMNKTANNHKLLRL